MGVYYKELTESDNYIPLPQYLLHEEIDDNANIKYSKYNVYYKKEINN